MISWWVIGENMLRCFELAHYCHNQEITMTFVPKIIIIASGLTWADIIAQICIYFIQFDIFVICYTHFLYSFFRRDSRNKFTRELINIFELVTHGP